MQIAMPLWVRPHLAPPAHASSAFNPATLDTLTSGGNRGDLKLTNAVHLPGAWVLSNHTVTPAGDEIIWPAPAACEKSTVPFSECTAALGRLGLRQVVTYQPAGRYWAFQGYETAIFVVLALGLGRVLCLADSPPRMVRALSRDYRMRKERIAWPMR